MSECPIRGFPLHCIGEKGVDYVIAKPRVVKADYVHTLTKTAFISYVKKDCL